MIACQNPHSLIEASFGVSSLSMIVPLDNCIAISFLFQDSTKIPSWLDISKTLVPDFVVKDPKVWFSLHYSNVSLSKLQNAFLAGIALQTGKLSAG